MKSSPNSVRTALGIGLAIGLTLGWVLRSRLESAKEPMRHDRVKRGVLTILRAAKDE